MYDLKCGRILFLKFILTALHAMECTEPLMELSHNYGNAGIELVVLFMDLG